MGKYVLLTLLLACCISITVSSPAQAQWTTDVTGPDVFGNTTVVASVFSEMGNGLVVQCDQNSTLELAFIFEATPTDRDDLSKAVGATPAELLIKVDQGQVIKFGANLRIWNNNYVGVVASGRTKDIVSSVNAISSAETQISVGAVIFGDQMSDAFDVANSTNAMTIASSDCKLNEIQSNSGSNSPQSQ